MFEESEDDLKGDAQLRAALGVDLDAYSVSDLEERISLLKSEIARCEMMIAKKGDMRAAAESVFKI